MTFALTAKQEEAQAILAGDATHGMLFGGSRSGKTFLHVRNIAMRALKAPNSRHAMFRFRLNHIKASIMMDTFPAVMRLAFPGVEYDLIKSDMYARMPNGAEVWFAGLDDKERTEKVLGQEFATIMLNECSQIPWASVQMVLTRLAQRATTKIKNRPDGVLRLRAFYDCNPPVKTHWTYRLFVEKVDPETRVALSQPANYVAMQINPGDNADNLASEYLDTLRSLSGRMQRRFLLGEFGDANPNALFVEESIDKWRSDGSDLPDMVRVVVAVDPSGSGDVDNADNDEIGIVVGGLGVDGNAYLLEDCTVKAGPATWGRIATSAFERHKADIVIGEANYGGAMVQQTILTARPRTPYKAVNATRGKVVRAEPMSALYEQGKVRHVGPFSRLEDELCAFSTVGYTGAGSPNRADAWIWALHEMFPGLVRSEKPKAQPPKSTVRAWQPGGWMG